MSGILDPRIPTFRNSDIFLLTFFSPLPTFEGEGFEEEDMFVVGRRKKDNRVFKSKFYEADAILII